MATSMLAMVSFLLRKIILVLFLFHAESGALSHAAHLRTCLGHTLYELSATWHVPQLHGRLHAEFDTSTPNFV